MHRKRPSVSEQQPDDKKTITRIENGDIFARDTKRRRFSLLVAASGLTDLARSVRSSKKDGLVHEAHQREKLPPMIDEERYNSDAVTYCRKTFPQLLMTALKSDKAAGNVQWRQDGASFSIIRRYDFMTEVMPSFFKKTKFESFLRKMKRWGFQQIQWGPECGAFQHPLFHRDYPDQCAKMRC
eukprot:14973983-Ditylum_brightwellii.AAC.1